MTEQRQLNGLIDFSELRRKHEDYNTITSKNSNSSQGIDFDLDSNEQIMKSFKSLRDKLKASNRDNQKLREEIVSMQVQLRQVHESQSNLTAINHQLKQKNQQLQQSNDEWRKRLSILKQQLSERSNLKDQLQFAKQGLIELMNKNAFLEDEKVKLIQISIEDKMSLEQRFKKLQMNKISDDKYLSQIETDLCKAKETILKLENALKKLEIKYDEEVFNKQWSKENFEREHYEKKVAELQIELSEVKAKNRKEKEKRGQIERRLLQLEEISGLCNVKAEVYEGEVDLMTKKLKKMERRVSQTKQNASKLASEKINWQQKFIKSASICEQLIYRVKRQVLGDMVELAKACEYKLNKLKQSKEGEKTDLSKSERISNPHRKNKTEKKGRSSIEKQNATTLKHEQSFKRMQLNSQNGKILFENDSNKTNTQMKQKNRPTYLITQTISKQGEQNMSSEINNIEIKVRKERQQMQKRLKEKMLYRKIQVSGSPLKTKLREDYLKLVFQR